MRHTQRETLVKNSEWKMEAEQLVASLFRVHLGLEEDTHGAENDALRVTTFRDLFRFPALSLYAQKVRLIAAAERTGCADVIMDVLLFVSQTMAKDAFYVELSKAPLCQQHWVQYELSLQRQDKHDQSGGDAHRLAVEASVAGILSTLVSTKTRPQDIAVVLLQLIFRHDLRVPLLATQAVAKEVLRVVTRIKPYRLPQWTIDLLEEFVELSDLQLKTEQRDAFSAPPAQQLSSYFDKRARGANNINANWRMRSFQLDETTLSYSKHDADKLAASRNPFLDKRVKGSVSLAKRMLVGPLNYAGKVSRRPYCIQIGQGDDALILDAGSPVVQSQWLNAIDGNIRRLELDPIWLQFPRPCVYRMSLHAFVKYVLLYHSESTRGAELDAPWLISKFKLDDKRLVFVSLLVLAQRGDWREFEALALATSKPKLFKPSTSSTDAGSAIGFGVILDIATQHNAPLSVIAKIEAMYIKYETKKPGWMCHTKTAATSDSVAIDIAVETMERRPSVSSSAISAL